MRRAFFITGTDTGVGKTTVACAVAAALAARGCRVGVSKPFETGCDAAADGTLAAADARRLRFFAGCDEPVESVCPYRAREPLAPSLALRRAGCAVDLAALREVVLGIVARHDVTLIEGAGGLLVPVTGTATFADLAAAWDVPVIVVVGNRLGALNHAQLTVRAAHSAGLRVAGYVVNALGPVADLAAQTNPAALAEILGPPLGALPWLGEVACTSADRARLAECAAKAIALARLIE